MASGGVMVLLIFVLGALLGVLAGGTLCVHYLRTAITADIGPQLRRMHADIDPQLRRMQNQPDNIVVPVVPVVPANAPALQKWATHTHAPASPGGLGRGMPGNG